jgi:hypothetical protein
VAVLGRTGAEMRVKEIHADVERLLDGSVSRYSVSDYLRRRSEGSGRLFVRVRRGHYRLLRDDRAAGASAQQRSTRPI